MPANLDRVVGLWIALHLDYLLGRSKLGKSIQPGGFIVFRRATSLGMYEKNSLRAFLLAQMRAERAAHCDTEALSLVAPLLHLARRAMCGPAFWDAPAGLKLREKVAHACRGEGQEWVRTGQHVSIPRIKHQWLYRLLAIADGRSLDELLIAWLFDIGDLRYRWTSGSHMRLAGLAEFWHAYASHRDRPRISRYRQVRGQLRNLLSSIAQSDAAMIAAAHALGLETVNIDLLGGRILEPGMESYRHTHLAVIAATIFRRNIIDGLGIVPDSATLQIRLETNAGFVRRTATMICQDGRLIQASG